MEKNEFNHTIAENIEVVKQRQPERILLGAILAQGNSLPLDKGRFYNLIMEMQAGNFEYPVSMQPIVDSVSFRDDKKYPESEQIESMYVRLSISKKLDFHNTKSSKDCLQMSDVTIYDFLEKYADDYDALEFFERCGEYLSESESFAT